MSFSVIQTIMGMIGSVGFAVLFGVRGRKLAVIALGSGAGWAVYLVCRAMGCSIFTGLLAAGLFACAHADSGGSGRSPLLYHVLSGAGISGRIWNLLRAGAHRGRSHCSGDHTCFPYGKIFHQSEESFAKQEKQKKRIEQEGLEFMKYVYASRSGNVEELVHILGLEAMKLKDGTETIDQDFILFTYTDGRGVVPPVVTAFLKENHSYLKGVIVSGNMQRHGDTFCGAGRIISEMYGVPVIAQVDGVGDAYDHRAIRGKLSL